MIYIAIFFIYRLPYLYLSIYLYIYLSLSLVVAALDATRIHPSDSSAWLVRLCRDALETQNSREETKGKSPEETEEEAIGEVLRSVLNTPLAASSLPPPFLYIPYLTPSLPGLHSSSCRTLDVVLGFRA